MPNETHLKRLISDAVFEAHGMAHLPSRWKGTNKGN